jgi:hypothetical protein
VKEVLQSLVDDNLVDFDKIGSANFYWALPSKAYQIVKTHKFANIYPFQSASL